MCGPDLTKQKNKLSVSLCYLLRHGATKENVYIDMDGYVNINSALTWLNGSHIKGVNIVCDPALLKEIVAEDEKGRYEITDTMIRCVQGHSILIEEAPKSEYKGPIFHGTAQRFLESILKTGLNGQTRNHVHMSKDIDTALVVGTRHGKPVILKISQEAFSESNPLLEAPNGVLLAKHIDPKYIEVL